jgi:hypothetical protein
MYGVARRLVHQTQGREDVKVVKELERLTVSQLVQFFDTCQTKYMNSKIEPGLSTNYNNNN